MPVARDNTLDIGDGVPLRHHVFRFYFDGLIAHMHRSKRSLKGIESFFVGCGPELVVQMQLFDDSFQLANLGQLMAENMKQWPAEAARITGKKKK